LDTETIQAPVEPLPLSRRHLSLSGLWAVVAVAIPFLALLAPKLSTIDLAYQIRAGDIMLRTHHLLATDVFSFTSAGQPWLNQQWGAQVVFALLYRLGGWPLLVVVRALLAAGIGGLVYLACRARGAGIKPAAGLTLASFALWMPGAILRPQLFGLLLFALTLWILSDRERNPGRLWWIPAIVMVWANVHGSFVLAPVLVGLAWLEARGGKERPGLAGRLVRVGLLSTVAANINPYGVRVWRYAVGIPTNRIIADTIQEWRPPTIRTEVGLAFFISVAVIAVLLARSRRAAPWPPLVALGVFFLLGLFAVRGIYWWALAVPPVMVGLLPHLRKRTVRETRSPVNTALAAMVVLLAVLFLPWWRTSGPTGSAALLDHAPPGVTAALATVLRPGDRVFDPELWGSWLEFRFPQNTVFDDSRIEVFSPSVWSQYDGVSAAAEGWQGVLDRWHVRVVVASRRQQGRLIAAMRSDPGWRLVHEDADGLVFVRTG
jgi:hypothetical protein